MTRRAFLVSAAIACAAVAMMDAAAPLRDRFVDGRGEGPPLVVVAATTFTMGTTPDAPSHSANSRVHQVEVSPYAIGAFEITNEEMCVFLNDGGDRPDEGVPPVHLDLPASGIEKRGARYVPKPGAARRPVVGVTWRGARAYCRWLSTKTGRAYDLPTAAQWEAAARAGSSATWWWGDRDEPSRYRGYQRGVAAPQPADVGSLPANPWGLHDTSGNVWEWTLDCFAPDFYLVSPRRDPVLFDAACMTPEIRGGGFMDPGGFASPGYRAVTVWAVKYDTLGFRVARQVTADEAARLAVNAARAGVTR
jgi:formylglycine-generating enzyme required for sulfatase activity